SERIGLCTRMRRFLVRFIRPESFVHTRSSAGFTITTSEFKFSVHTASLCLFLRGPSRIQPPEAIAGALRFIGRHTLEIYAIQLAGSELLVKLVPDITP
ncbi:MAG TPA: hypothetical protein VF396_16765, partial [Bradyrhizobium sp.]